MYERVQKLKFVDRPGHARVRSVERDEAVCARSGEPSTSRSVRLVVHRRVKDELDPPVSDSKDGGNSGDLASSPSRSAKS